MPKPVTVPKIRFVGQKDDLATKLATWDYEKIWQADGQRIAQVFYDLTGIRFWYKHITAHVVQSNISRAGSRYYRMRLSSYEYEGRARILTHELAHRLLFGNYMGMQGKTHRYWDHYRIDLFLYDAWVRLYGIDTAKKYVAKEKANEPDAYKKAWLKVMSLTFKQRQEKIRKMISRVPKKYLS